MQSQKHEKIRLKLTYIFSAPIKGELAIGVIKENGMFQFYKNELGIEFHPSNIAKLEETISHFIIKNLLKREDTIRLIIKNYKTIESTYYFTVLVELANPALIKIHHFKMFPIKKLLSNSSSMEVQTYVAQYLSAKGELH